MRFIVPALLATLVFAVAGCNQPANDNLTTNRNANVAVTPTPVINSNVNANTNTNKAPTRAEYESNKERYQREAKESGRTIGTGLNDGWLWTKARFDLAAADDLRDSTINVDVSNAVVTLTGTVASQAQVVKAQNVVKAVEGVKSVSNRLKVVPSNTNAASANTNRKK